MCVPLIVPICHSVWGQAEVLKVHSLEMSPVSLENTWMRLWAVQGVLLGQGGLRVLEPCHRTFSAVPRKKVPPAPC